MNRCLCCARPYASGPFACPHCGESPAVSDGVPLFAPRIAEETLGYTAEHYEALFAIEDRSFWFRARSRLIEWSFGRYFPLARSFFEVGAGTGFVLRGMSRAYPSVVLAGSEVLTRGLSFARSRVRHARWIQMDARAIPFTEEFDVLGAFDVLEHVQEDEHVLSEMFRATRPGGGVILTVPQHPRLWSAADDDARHVRRYRRGELSAKVARAGFRIRRVTSFVTLLLPAMIGARLFGGRARADQGGDAYRELRASSGGLVGEALYAVMSLERLLLRGGLSAPVGGSLLLVADKPG